MSFHDAKTDSPKRWMILIILLIAVAAMRLMLVFVHEANWDEYLNLSMIYDHQRGDLREILQTGFVHLFGWVTSVSDNEADQIIAARLVYFGAGIITSVAMWKISRALVSKEAALFSVICYWAFSYNLIHGVSLRTDPLATCAMICALWLVISGSSVRTAFAAGLLAGLAGFFTIKAIFYVPALVAVTLIRWARIGSLVQGIGVVCLIGIAAFFFFVGLSALHAMTFAEIASPLAFLDRTTGSTLSAHNFSIFLRYLQQAVSQNAVLFVVMLVGLAGLLKRLWHHSDRTAGLLGLALLTPVLSFCVYRDTYPYFYPFALASAVTLVGFAWDDLYRRYGATIPMVLAVGVCLSAAVATVKNAQQNIATQRMTLDVIHRLFPDKPSYIDGRSMVSSLPKRGLFMSTWGMTDYRRAGRPVMANIIQTYQPQFLLANIWHLHIDKMSPAQSERQQLGLMAADMTVLQNNYAQLWGPLYVPAKSFGPDDQSMLILLAGTYRLAADAPVSIDGTIIEPNAEIRLEVREYVVSASGIAQLILDVEQPNEIPPEGRLFGGF